MANGISNDERQRGLTHIAPAFPQPCGRQFTKSLRPVKKSSLVISVHQVIQRSSLSSGYNLSVCGKRGFTRPSTTAEWHPPETRSDRAPLQLLKHTYELQAACPKHPQSRPCLLLDPSPMHTAFSPPVWARPLGATHYLTLGKSRSGRLAIRHLRLHLPHSGPSSGNRIHFQVGVPSGKYQPERKIQDRLPKMYVSRKLTS